VSLRDKAGNVEQEEQAIVMASLITTGYEQLLEEARQEIEEIPAAEAVKLKDDAGVVFVDIRERRELEMEGRVPGSVHAPRGMLEFWVDPVSPYFRPIFGEDKKFILYCAAGWRSALATQTLQRMGLRPVAHIVGGFGAWKEAGGVVEAYIPRDAGPAKSKPNT
jgi:rhodanese-related sulfurtransferase